jgi:hypothetical protein
VSALRAKQPTKRVARKERAAAVPLSQTQLAEAEARSRAAEAELLAMLELEDRKPGNSKGKTAKAKR